MPVDWQIHDQKHDCVMHVMPGDNIMYTAAVSALTSGRTTGSARNAGCTVMQVEAILHPHKALTPRTISLVQHSM